MNNSAPYKLAVMVCLVPALINVAKSQDTISTKKDIPCPVAIYLTFDDGPVKESRYLLSLVSSDTCAINAFFVGQYAFATEEQQDILQEYRSNPVVEIGNHSFTHANKKYKTFYSQTAEVIKDIALNEDALSLYNKLVRLPGRNVWRLRNRQRTDLEDARLVADSLAKNGYTIIGWDLEWRYDATTRSYKTAEYLIRLIKQMTAGARTFTTGTIVILCHDQMLKDEGARRELQLFLKSVKVIPQWKFEHLSNYPGVDHPSENDFFQ
jgi:peptidoglycan-N-acetylglucosamine deacetylase